MTYTEEELLALYEDVLSVPVPQPTVSEDKRGAIENTQLEEDRKILKELDKRLLNHVHEDEPHYRRILIRAFEVVSRAENARQAVQVDSESSKPLPLGVLSHVECEALIRAAVRVLFQFLIPSTNVTFSSKLATISLLQLLWKSCERIICLSRKQLSQKFSGCILITEMSRRQISSSKAF